MYKVYLGDIPLKTKVSVQLTLGLCHEMFLTINNIMTACVFLLGSGCQTGAQARASEHPGETEDPAPPAALAASCGVLPCQHPGNVNIL